MMKSLLIRTVCLLLVSAPVLALGKKQGPSPWLDHTPSTSNHRVSEHTLLGEHHEGIRCARKCTYRPS